MKMSYSVCRKITVVTYTAACRSLEPITVAVSVCLVICNVRGWFAIVRYQITSLPNHRGYTFSSLGDLVSRSTAYYQITRIPNHRDTVTNFHQRWRWLYTRTQPCTLWRGWHMNRRKRFVREDVAVTTAGRELDPKERFLLSSGRPWCQYSSQRLTVLFFPTWAITIGVYYTTHWRDVCTCSFPFADG